MIESQFKSRGKGLALFAVLAAALAGCATTTTDVASPSERARLEAAEQARTTGTVRAEDVDALRRLGYARNTSWSFATAEETYRDLAIADPAIVGPTVPIEARINRAINLSNQGKFPQANAEMDAAKAALAENDNAMLQVKLGLARTIDAGNQAARKLGDERTAGFQEAIMLADQSISLAGTVLSRAGTRAGTGASQEADGTIVIGVGTAARYNETTLRTGGAISEALGRPMTDAERVAILRIHALYAKAAALAAVGELGKARESNLLAQRAFEDLPLSYTPWLRASIAEQRGNFALLANDPSTAQSAVTSAIALLRQSYADTRLEAAMWRTKGRAQQALGDENGALESEKTSFDIINRQTDGSPATRLDVAPYLSLLAPLAIEGDQTKVADFFQAASVAVETATARTVAQVAARFASGNDETAAAIRSVQDAEREVRRLKVREAVVLAAQEASDDEKRQATLAIIGAENTLKAVKASASAVTGQKAGAFISSETPLKDLQAALRPGEIYVRFVFVGDGIGYAAITSGDDARVYKLGMDEASIKASVDKIRGFTNAVEITLPDGSSVRRRPPFRVDDASALYKALFGPADTLVQGAQHVIIEPAGPLFSLPFAALPIQGFDDAGRAAFVASRGQDYSKIQWLGRDRTITLSVGAAGFVRLRASKPSNAPQPLLAFANPIPSSNVEQTAIQVSKQRSLSGSASVVSAKTGTIDPALLGIRGADPICVREAEMVLGFAPLLDTDAEVRAVAAALSADPKTAIVDGEAFTDNAVRERKDLNQFRVLYFATHGVLPDAFQCWPDPFLSTSTGGGSDGALEATEIADLSLDADLVVLSACDTAGSGTAENASGLEGAGEALGGLAQSFTFAGSRGLLVSHWAVDSKRTGELMAALFQSEAGAGSTEAALTLAQRSLMLTPEASHPYFWAAFTLVGEGVRRTAG